MTALLDSADTDCFPPQGKLYGMVLNGNFLKVFKDWLNTTIMAVSSMRPPFYNMQRYCTKYTHHLIFKKSFVFTLPICKLVNSSFQRKNILVCGETDTPVDSGG